MCLCGFCCMLAYHWSTYVPDFFTWVCLMGAWKWWSFTVQLSFFLRGTIKALSVGFIILYDVGSHCFQDYITLVVTLWIMENLNSCKNFFYLNYLKSLHFNKKWNILVENNKIGLFYQNLQTYYIPEYFFTPVASSIMVQVCG